MSEREAKVLEQQRTPTGNRINNIAETVEKKSTLNDLNILKSYSNSDSTAPVRENWGWSGESPRIKAIHYFLTKETFSMATKIFRFGAFFKCVPFELEFNNGESLRVRPFKKQWQWALWHIVTWIIFAAIAFEFISFGFLWQRASFGKEMAFHIMYLLLAAWIFVYALALYLNPMACIVMLNHHDEIMRNSSRFGLSKKHWASHPFVILSVYYMTWAFVLFDLVFVAFYLRNPERSQYIYSALPSAWTKDDWILYGLCALAELFWFGCGFTLLTLFFCYWCADIYTFNGSLNALREREKLNERTIESYLSLQLFCNSFNDFNGDLFSMGFCFLLFSSPVLFIYLALTTFNLLSIIVFLGFPTFAAMVMGLIVLFLPQHSKVQIKSVDVLEHFSHLPIELKPSSSSGFMEFSHFSEGERRGYLRRRVKAFRRLRIQISFFGAFSLDTSGVLVDQIFNNILLLLSL